jgi:hypothetical protein
MLAANNQSNDSPDANEGADINAEDAVLEGDDDDEIVEGPAVLAHVDLARTVRK